MRLTWYVTDKRDYLGNLAGIGAAYREIIGRHYPAMALVQVAGLVEDRAKVEIEATGRRAGVRGGENAGTERPYRQLRP